MGTSSTLQESGTWSRCTKTIERSKKQIDGGHPGALAIFSSYYFGSTPNMFECIIRDELQTVAWKRRNLAGVIGIAMQLTLTPSRRVDASAHFSISVNSHCKNEIHSWRRQLKVSFCREFLTPTERERLRGRSAPTPETQGRSDPCSPGATDSDARGPSLSRQQGPLAGRAGRV